MYFAILFSLVLACDADGDGFAACPGDRDCTGDDCNDDDASVYPGAAESCGWVDHDCNSVVGFDEVGMDCDEDGISIPADSDDLNSCVGKENSDLCGGE